MVARHSGGAPLRCEYYRGGVCVGRRGFHPSGDLQYEFAYKDGRLHGWQYRWDLPGELLSAEPWEEGLPHGTAHQWARDGRLLGSYTLEHGTGVDVWWQEAADGTAYLVEARYLRDGLRHGFEWWMNEDQESVSVERHCRDGVRHGIEREWDAGGRLRRGYPRFYIRGSRVEKREYLKASDYDPSLPSYHEDDNSPHRLFPPEVSRHLREIE